MAIGSVLTAHPRMLVLDEPTSALDPTAAEDVLAAVTRLVHDLGVTVVLAEHRLERVVQYADRMVPARRRRHACRWTCPAVVLATSPVAPPAGRARPARRLVAAAAVGPGRPPARRALRARLADAVAPPTASAVPRGGVPDAAAACARGGSSSATASTVAVRGGRPRPCSPARSPPSWAATAPGKSSLLWALQGRAGGESRAASTVGGRRPGRSCRPPSAGRSSGWSRRPPPTCSTWRPSARSAPTPTATPAPSRATARGILDRLAPGIDGGDHPRDLSEGQRLRAGAGGRARGAPAGGAARRADPRPGLRRPRRALAALLRGLAAAGRAVLVATHDVEFVAAVADGVVVLAEGEVVADGPTADGRRRRRRSRRRSPRCSRPPWLTVEQVAAGAGRAAVVSATRPRAADADPVPGARGSGRGPPWCWRWPRSPG